jgi:glycerol-3-phosphate dehydrogenase (NAD(P)+)
MAFSKIGVVGAGAWGLALAIAAARAGRAVRLWGREGAAFAELAATRRSPRLPGVTLPAGIDIFGDLAALGACDALLLVAPAQATREAAGRLAAALSARPPLVICAKGVERATGLFMSEVVAEAAPGFPLAVLSGPSFAVDMAAGLPTAVTLAAEDAGLAAALADALQGPNLRLYDSDDRRGVEIGGAAKNVLAIACGAAAGLKLGASAGAALVARGFAELSRFGAAYGARPSTLMGLSGLGDLVLTCASPQSRNFAYGFDLGRGLSPAEAGGGKLAEGAFTAPALLRLARARGVDMPIAEAVNAVIAGEISAREAVEMLLSRPRKSENE